MGYNIQYVKCVIVYVCTYVRIVWAKLILIRHDYYLYNKIHDYHDNRKALEPWNMYVNAINHMKF